MATAKETISALRKVHHELRRAPLPETRQLGVNIDSLIELIEDRELKKLRQRRKEVL